MTSRSRSIASPDIEGIVALAAELVRLPSRGGADSPAPVLTAVGGWLSAQGLAPSHLKGGDDEIVGVHVRCAGEAPGPTLCLDACIDTAPFGDQSVWSRPPTSGAVSDGRLWGRGAADSKMGAAILAHVVRDLARDGSIARGGVELLLDADEHTGRFGGARAYLAALDRPPDGALLGYPGNDELIRGSRGFLRLRLHVAGRAAHSGATGDRGVNAIGRLARIVAALEDAKLPAEAAPFDFGPSVTVTEIDGGEGFSQVPDRASCSVDIRLTPGFGEKEAQAWLADIVPQGARLERVECWPPYVVAEGDPLVRAFQGAGSAAFGRAVPLAVCGPSNIGNLFAAHCIPTICGLGVTAENVHGTDECARIDSIPAVYRGYYEGVRRFLEGV